MQVTIPTSLNGDVDVPVSSGQQTIYRQTLELSLETGGQADGVVVDPLQTVFGAEFDEKEYDVLDSSGPFAQIPSSQVAHGALIIELNRPARVHRIRLFSQAFPEVLYAIEAIDQGLFDNLLAPGIHTDLSALAASTGSYRDRNELRLAAEQDYARGHTWTIGIDTLELYRVDGATIVDNPTITVGNNQVPDDEFITDRFAIRAYSGGADPSLKAGMLEQLWVRSVPTSPRIGLVRTSPEIGESTPENFFWRLSGEQLDTTQASFLNEQASELLQAALQAYLDDYFTDLLGQALQNGHSPQIPEYIELSLVLESDTPCTFIVNNLQIHYSLIRQSSSLLDKQGIALPKTVLRFQGSHLETQKIQVHLPLDAQIRSATLQATSSFAGDDARLIRPVPTKLRETDRQGFYMDNTAWAAQAVRPDKALTLTGLLLGLLTLQEEVELSLEVREDWNDGPNGNMLARASFAATGSGQREWLRVDFDSSIVLTAALSWITLRVAKGSAVWLTEESTGETFRGYLDRGKGEQPRLQVVLPDKAGLYRYVSCCRKADQLPITVEVEGVDAGIASENEKTLVLDITDGLTAPRAGGGSSDTVDIEFATPLKGMLTLHPARVEYELT